MPHHKSAAKRMRTSEKARARNRAVRSRVKGAIKAIDQAEGTEQTDEALRKATSELDRAARKRVIPARRVARKKSRLARAHNAATSSE